MPDYKKYFSEIINEMYPEKNKVILNDIDLNFNVIKRDISFAKSSANPLDRRLEISGYFLATIKALALAGEDYDKIRAILLKIAREYVRPKNKLQLFLKKLPARFITGVFGSMLLKQLDKKARKKTHPDGFVATLITDKKETLGLGYGIDILECGICKLFAKHNSEKYSPILCEVDFITSSMAGLTLVRSGTIANGAAKCDFRFTK